MKFRWPWTRAIQDLNQKLEVYSSGLEDAENEIADLQKETTRLQTALTECWKLASEVTSAHADLKENVDTVFEFADVIFKELRDQAVISEAAYPEYRAYDAIDLDAEFSSFHEFRNDTTREMALLKKEIQLSGLKRGIKANQDWIAALEEKIDALSELYGFRFAHDTKKNKTIAVRKTPEPHKGKEV